MNTTATVASSSSAYQLPTSNVQSQAGREHSTTLTPFNGTMRTIWSPEMEARAIALYVKSVQEGKRSTHGFKPETHNDIAKVLSEEFPDSYIDGARVKSKCHQSFKRDYDTINLMKMQTGFVWDEERFAITAPDEVWTEFFRSHPHAKKFRGNPFPELRDLEIIFGAYAPPVAVAPSAPPQAPEEPESLEIPEVPALPSRINFEQAEENLHTSELDSVSSRQKQSHISGFQEIAAAIERLADAAFQSQKSQKSNVERAIEMLQDDFSLEMSPNKMIASLSVLEKPAKAVVFTTIRDRNLRLQWLQHQIKFTFQD